MAAQGLRQGARDGDGEVTLKPGGPPSGAPDRAPELVAGRYAPIELIGQGGFGDVYRARDRQTGEDCALKLLRPEAYPRGLPDLRRARGLPPHPHLVRILDADILDDGTAYLAMELVEGGRSLAAVLAERGALPAAHAVRLADGILAGLAAGHRAGFLHRDLSPSNVLLVLRDGDPLFPKVLDFDLGEPGQATAAADGEIVGTPAYMAPELFAGVPPNPRTDLYAAGAVLCALLTGRPPFSADRLPTRVAALPEPSRQAWAHENFDPPPLPGASAPLASLVLELLAKQPTARPPDALAARTRLRATPEAELALDVLSAAMSPLPQRATRRPSARRPAWLLALGLVGASLGAWLMREARRPIRPASPAPSAAPAPPEDPKVPTCRERIETLPPGARVDRGGQPLGFTPLVVLRPCAARWEVRVSYPGHRGATLALDAPTDQPPRRLTLQPEGT